MKQVGGWFVPDHELHLGEWFTHEKNRRDIVDGRQRYQGRKQDAAMKLCKQFRTAVDVGGHVGLWSYYLAQRFAAVHAFEPVAEHRECFAANVTAPNVTLHACALGETDGFVSMNIKQTSSGGTKVDGHSMLAAIAGVGDIPMRRLDEFEFQDVDFLKIDTEGFELFVLRGGEEMLKRCRPCVIVEQKPGGAQKFGLKETEAVPYLQSLGAVLRQSISGDFFFTWD